MGAKIIGVSIKEEHKQFLDNNEYFSPSEMLQNCINNAIAYKKSLNTDMVTLKNKLEIMQREYDYLVAFLHLNEMWKKFVEYKEARRKSEEESNVAI